MDLASFCQMVFNAAHSGNWKYVVALALVGAVALARWAAPKMHDKVGEFLNGDRGGVVLAFCGAFFGAIATSFGAGHGFDFKLAADSFTMALTAIGGYSAVKKLLFPKSAEAEPAAK